LYQVLNKNLASCWSGVRVASLMSLAHFLKRVQDLNTDTVFAVCARAERTPAQLSTYRERLVAIQSLEFRILNPLISHPLIEQIDSVATIPLRYLLGSLYTNFSLLEKPTLNLILSYGNEIPLRDFWTVYVDALETATRNSRRILLQTARKSDDLQ